jgi:hypothetical protein
MQDSARGKNPQKFQDDALVLEAVLKLETDPFLLSRYTFYLAQSYRDAEALEPALEAYLRRSKQGYWQEEVYISLLNAARLKERLAYSPAEQLQAFMDAFESLPSRLEALHDAIRLCRLQGRYQQGYILGRYALSIPQPVEGLFIEQWVADYGLLDEFSIVAYWAGCYQESLDACRRLLTEAKIPLHYQQRVKENADFAIGKLQVSRGNS